MNQLDKSDAVIDDGEPSFEVLKEEAPIELPEDIKELTKIQLRNRLIKAGYKPGPFHSAGDIENHKKKLYLLEQKNIYEYGCPEELHPIRKIIYDIQHGRKVTTGATENQKLKNEYDNRKNPNHVTEFYNYFMIDPTMITDLENCSFEEFVAALIYIGKGIGGRELDHLRNASLSKKERKCRGHGSDKLQRIVNIWKQGRGVIIIICGTYMSEKQALFRENAAITARGLKTITNERNGTSIKLPSGRVWTDSEIINLGARSLYNAFQLFCIDERNEMHENNVKLR